ncbi:hypothetical protein E7V67_021785 [[Empedobacter] haloabium]|uniref:Uncharacterized protein n=1 Tax=[Empedobacter] haloabium TaxID=592317 RepID=A0ABZ1UHZ5_9BURK
MTGWERDAGDLDFNFRIDLARWYDFSATDLSLSDDFDLDLDLRVRATAGDYGKVWHALVPKFKSVHHTASQSPPSGRSSTTASSDTIHTSIGSATAGTTTGSCTGHVGESRHGYRPTHAPCARAAARREHSPSALRPKPGIRRLRLGIRR